MIHSNIESLMEEQGITPNELEERTNLSAEAINTAMGDMIGECRLSTLREIAMALDVRIVDLFVINKEQS